MENKQGKKDMRQPNSFQELGTNTSSSKNEGIKDMRQPNSFQEQAPNNNGHLKEDVKEDNHSFSMKDTISRQEDSKNK